MEYREPHELKTWSVYFDLIDSGQKTFELRKNDRDFQVGDRLILKEWDPETSEYTGRMMIVKVLYIMPGGQFGLDPGYVCMAIKIEL